MDDNDLSQKIDNDEQFSVVMRRLSSVDCFD